jgi:hypothetical protein
MASESAITSPVAIFLRRYPQTIPLGVLFILAVAGYFFWAASQPAQGGWRYGVCRSLIEFESAYPPTIEILSASEEQATARIFYSERNPFGNERIIQADCDYQINSQAGTVKLARLSFDRKPVSQAKIARYNALVQVLMTQQMNTDLPKALPRSLDQLKR